MNRYASFNRFELEVPAEAVNDCSHSGRCDDDVAAWQSKVDFSKIDDATLAAELKECGAWDEAELADRDANEKRILWLACGQLRDEDCEAQS